MKILKIYCFVMLSVIQLVSNAQPSSFAEWRFDNSDNLTEASTGSDLTLVGTHEAIEGPMDDNKAVRIEAGSHYLFQHDVPPGVEENNVNKYSILFDFRINDEGMWHAFFQTDENNSNDAELFIRNSDRKIGVADAGYSNTSVKTGRWHRLVVVVDNGNELSLYLDTIKVLTGSVQEIDGRFSLQDNIIFFGDNNGEDNTIDVARISFYDYPLTQNEVTELGLIEQPEIAPVAFLTKPYLQNVSSSGITVMWESEFAGPGQINFGKSSELTNQLTSTVSKTQEETYIHKVVLTALEPSSSYSYEVEMEGENSEIKTFTTAPANDSASFTVGIWGDSHYASPWMYMADFIVNTMKADFAFNSGDLSNQGNSRSDISTVFLPHVCERIGSNIPFFSTMGNHDVGSRWGGGDLIRQYHDFPAAVNSDTNAFDGSYLMMYSNVAFISVDWNRMETDVLTNGWLEEVLKSDKVKNARFRFIFIHCAPFYERWQVAENEIVKEHLPALAAKYNVDAVFSGHMHGYERGLLNGVTYITQGGASYMDVNEEVGPEIYEHIIRGSDKTDNPSGFNNGLTNHVLSLDITEDNAIIKLHYFNDSGTYLGVMETISLVNLKTSVNTLKDSQLQIIHSKLNDSIEIESDIPFRLALYNTNGSRVYEDKTWSRLVQFKSNNLNTGIYILSVETQAGDITTRKMYIN